MSSSYFFPPPRRHHWSTVTFCCVSQRGFGWGPVPCPDYPALIPHDPDDPWPCPVHLASLGQPPASTWESADVHVFGFTVSAAGEVSAAVPDPAYIVDLGFDPADPAELLQSPAQRLVCHPRDRRALRP